MKKSDKIESEQMQKDDVKEKNAEIILEEEQKKLDVSAGLEEEEISHVEAEIVKDPYDDNFENHNESSDSEDSNENADSNDNADSEEHSATDGDDEIYTKSIVGLVLGVVAVIFDFIYPFVGVTCGIVGIVFSVKAGKTENSKGMAKAGLILSIVAVSIFGVMAICSIALVGAVIGGAFGVLSLY